MSARLAPTIVAFYPNARVHDPAFKQNGRIPSKYTCEAPRIIGEPWKAEGISRATWFRRRARAKALEWLEKNDVALERRSDAVWIVRHRAGELLAELPDRQAGSCTLSLAVANTSPTTDQNMLHLRGSNSNE